MKRRLGCVLALYCCGRMGVQAVINLNLKSSHLSNLLRDPAQDSTPDNSPSRTAVAETLPTVAHGNKQQNKADILQLDLSGRIDTLVVGPETSRLAGATGGEVEPLPLIRTDWPFSVIASADYDFSKAWYGVRRLCTTLRWDNPKEFLKNQRNRRHNLLLPSQIYVAAERGVGTADIYDPIAGEIGVGWDSGETKMTTKLKARIANTGCASLSLALPTNRRSDLEITVVNSLRLPGQVATTKWNEDWWIPDVSLNALGHLKTRNEGWFQSPFKKYFDGSLGLRLVVRRRLGWSMLGVATDTDPETWVALDLKGLDRDRRYATTARVVAQLQRPLASAHLSFSQYVAAGAY